MTGPAPDVGGPAGCADGGLFALPPDHRPGRAVVEPTPPPAPAAVVNDMDLIEAVLSRALEPGYVLVGDGARVWRRRTARSEDIEPVPADEAAAVQQLLAARLLLLGGTHRVRHGRRTGHARAVRVTDGARARIRRWRAFIRPACWGQPRHTA